LNYENILFEYEESTAVITINRRQYLNALDINTLKELEDAFDVICGNTGIKAVIITGAGDKAFIAGADIKEMSRMTPFEAREFSYLGLRVTKKMEQLPQAVIGAINGFALGGGCEIALACDIRIASEHAKFGQPEVGLGITPGFGGTQRMPRLIGKGRGSELLFTGRMVGSEEALNIGLVNYVVPRDKLMEKSRELAKSMGEKGNIARGLIKSAILKGQSMDLDRALDLEADSFALCFSTQEQREGMEAFLNKRKPNFQNSRTS